MNSVFYGSAIQGGGKRGERTHVHGQIIKAIKDVGYIVSTEHTSSIDKSGAMALLEKSIGKLPDVGPNRTKFIRDKMIELVEGNVKACVFELSVPSIGTGIEFAHAYLRPKMGLTEVPILVLYQKSFWPNGLSSMVWGVKYGGMNNLTIIEYESLDDACSETQNFLSKIKV